MRIAVIADTHDRLPVDLAERLRGAGEIWHLGDVCAPETLAELELLGVPLRVVRGNCDAHPWPVALDLVREGHRAHLVHIPPRRPPAGAELVLHGHTHVPRDGTDPLGVLGPRGVESGKCAVCRRALTDAQSKLRGLGPDCLALLNPALSAVVQ